MKRRLYLETVAITGSPQQPVIGGSGPGIEYAVKMREFPQSALLDSALARGEVSVATIQALAPRTPAGPAGRVRECHGDLHLGNIALLDGAATPFDCIEFNPALRWMDVISEMAFLVMDLEAHGRRDLAYAFLNSYLEASGDYAGG